MVAFPFVGAIVVGGRATSRPDVRRVMFLTFLSFFDVEVVSDLWYQQPADVWKFRGSWRPLLHPLANSLGGMCDSQAFWKKARGHS